MHVNMSQGMSSGTLASPTVKLEKQTLPAAKMIDKQEQIELDKETDSPRRSMPIHRDNYQQDVQQ